LRMDVKRGCGQRENQQCQKQQKIRNVCFPKEIISEDPDDYSW
jgi:hypothetical protein